VRKVFPQPDVDCSVREGVRDDEAVLWRRKASANVTGRVESRWATYIPVTATAQRDQTAELDAEGIWHVHDPIDHSSALLVIGRVLRDANGVREVEQVTEIVLALHLAVGVGVRQPSSPAEGFARPAIRAVDGDLQRIVPGLRVVRRVDQVAEAVSADV